MLWSYLPVNYRVYFENEKNKCKTCEEFLKNKCKISEMEDHIRAKHYSGFFCDDNIKCSVCDERVYFFPIDPSYSECEICKKYFHKNIFGKKENTCGYLCESDCYDSMFKCIYSVCYKCSPGYKSKDYPDNEYCVNCFSCKCKEHFEECVINEINAHSFGNINGKIMDQAYKDNVEGTYRIK